ncbi:GST_C domain-containing protein/GST_N_3 domain-containing protein [Cephalotus follicularis]|uniref:Glutathione S-transferase n=1 Tax=Cephalotus follicularis TaxID=3775 RepID=A0A1Q3BEQ5_CEPFO|nr:GST_C domain-containing protein/GST_N_3 domain-containing protein [Cephalotus follicularis]
MGELKVIGCSKSLFCTRVEWALKLKGCEYEYIEEDLRNKSPILLKYNPVHKKVPVLVHDDKPIPESLVILEYIDETWKLNPLLPEDPYERATARFWAKFSDDKCLYGAFGACTAEGEAKERAIETTLESFGYLEKQIQGKKFFGGEEISYLDLVAGWIPHLLNVIEEVGGMKLVDAERLPSLHEWAHNFIQIPLIKECIPPREDLVVLYSAHLSYIRSLEPKKQ